MKRTFTINIGGTVFHIDEDAYEKLNNYLQRLSKHFGTGEDGQEIIRDIESRLAELFNEIILRQGSKVISIPCVDEIIGRMGMPEEFEDDDIKSGIKRKMYRDTDNKIFGGVCSGLGAWFNIDSNIIRIIFVILIFVSFGFAILAYIVLWIVVPGAKTTAQKLEMRGMDATISNIEKVVKEGVDDLQKEYNKFKDSGAYQRGKKSISGICEKIKKLFGFFFNIFRILLGIFFILMSTLFAVFIAVSLFLGDSFFPLIVQENFIPSEWSSFLMDSTSLTILVITAIVLIGIPTIMVFFTGAKMVFRFKSNSKAIFLSSLGLWIVALFIAGFTILGQVRDFSMMETVSSGETIAENQPVLYLELKNNLNDRSGVHYFNNRLLKKTIINGDPIYMGRPNLRIEKSSNTDFMVILEKRSRGRYNETARTRADTISYEYTHKDSILSFNNYFNYNYPRWRDQNVNIILRVPVGKSIYIDKDISQITWYYNNMMGKYLEMTEHGLKEKITANDSNSSDEP